jgi:hypothetical protein
MCDVKLVVPFDVETNLADDLSVERIDDARAFLPERSCDDAFIRRLDPDPKGCELLPRDPP